MSNIHGVISPCITLFKENGSVDEAATADLWTYFFENGVDGLFVTGSYGLGPLMTNEERVGLFEVAAKVREKFPDRKLIAHVGAADTASAVLLAKSAEKLGFDAVAAVAPWYNKYSENLIFDYFKSIIKSVNIPTYAYNNPSTSGFMFTLNFVQRLQAVGLKGLKDASVNFKFLSAVYYDAKQNNKDFQVILGTENCWLTWSQMGADTIIGGMTNYVPDVDYKLKKIFECDNYDAKVDAYILMSNFRKQILYTDSTISSHVALKATGHYAGYTRAPMEIEYTEEHINNAKKLIAGIREDIDSLIDKYSLEITDPKALVSSH
ncbi:dihydrodipicolinate synthase family protein [Companilactobacillus huachuanensis]|uniref:Dihydrodipicolinate synthase family protein n=1 Tax=Companilactobacillus huachuanensis TaxID=2559914 RepID=A0ABW1RQE2_9LACO|nr:dihydrodipicolinate synthase family protein [Companilactobacillus huachuanensis]